MKCSKCGAEVASGNGVCTSCGSKMNAEGQMLQSTTKPKRRFNVKMIFSIVVGVLIVGNLLFGGSKKSEEEIASCLSEFLDKRVEAMTYEASADSVFIMAASNGSGSYELVDNCITQYDEAIDLISVDLDGYDEVEELQELLLKELETGKEGYETIKSALDESDEELYQKGVDLLKLKKETYYEEAKAKEMELREKYNIPLEDGTDDTQAIN